MPDDTHRAIPIVSRHNATAAGELGMRAMAEAVGRTVALVGKVIDRGSARSQE